MLEGLRLRQPLLLLVFSLSGAAGLIYEVVWTRKLTLVFGVTSVSVSTVLAVYMGGLAIGSWWLGRFADRVRSPIALYGLLELGVAAWGAASLALVDQLPALFVALHRGLGEASAWLRPPLAASVLLPPTVMMGATLPVLVRGLSRGPERIGRDAGLLYAVNTLGAVAGTVAAGFWLIQTLGLRGTTLLAAGVNLACALAALLLARPAVAAPPPAPTAVVDRAPVLVRPIMIAFAISGFVSLGYEVLWTRYLVYVLGENSVHAFALMLACFLLGLTLGSAAVGRAADSSRNPVALLGAILILIGAAAMTSAALIGVLVAPRGEVASVGLWQSTAWASARCLLVLLVPTTLSGATFAVVARIAASDRSRIGRDLGRLYGANTFGAILGAVAAGIAILPWLGLRRGLVVLASVHVLTGAGLLRLARSRGRAVGLAWGAAVALLLALVVLWAAPDPTQRLARPGYSLAFYADGPESSVAVMRNDSSGHLGLIVDGDGQAHTAPRHQVHLRLLGHLPLLFHPAPRDVLVVALGAGVTAGAVARHPVERVEVVELSRAVIAAAPLFAPFNDDPLADPRVHLLRGDARTYLLTTDRSFDAITSDPVDPDDAGATSLHSLEYFRLVRARLKPGGVACQWLDTDVGLEEYRMLVRTFLAVFPHTSIWGGAGFTVLVGSAEPPGVTLADLRRRWQEPRVRASLAVVGLDSPQALLSCLIATPLETRAFAGDGPLNTDDHPLIEYLGPQWSRGGAEQQRLWSTLLALGNEPSSWVAGWSAADREACRAARSAMAAAYEHARLRAAFATPVPMAEGSRGWVEHRRRIRDRFLELTWQLLLPSTPGIARLTAGAVTPDLEPVNRPAAPRREASENALRLGQEAWDAGDFVAARGHFQATSAAAPLSPRPALLAAACALKSGQPAAGVHALLAVAADDPWVDDLAATCAWLALEEAVENGSLSGPAAASLERELRDRTLVGG